MSDDEIKPSKRSVRRKKIASAVARKGDNGSILLKPSESVAKFADDLALGKKATSYVEGRLWGLKKGEAAKLAGMTNPNMTAWLTEKNPKVQEVMRREQFALARDAGFTRKSVLEGIKDAIDDAKILSDPSAQIAGWREIAKICGFYAPEVKKIELSDDAKTAMDRLQSLSDDELLRLTTAKTIEAEYSEVTSAQGL